MEWIEIRNGTVPKAGDEMLCMDPDTNIVFDLRIVTRKMAEEWTWVDYRADWWFWFRPLDAPKIAIPVRADNGDPDTIVPAPARHKKRPDPPETAHD